MIKDRRRRSRPNARAHTAIYVVDDKRVLLGGRGTYFVQIGLKYNDYLTQ